MVMKNSESSFGASKVQVPWGMLMPLQEMGGNEWLLISVEASPS